MNRRQFLTSTTAAILTTPAILGSVRAQEGPFRVKYYPVASGMGSRDVAPAPDGTIWFCGQRNGTLGRLEPRDGSFKLIDLGKGAAPHGVVIGPDGAPWITEGGQNAIARVDPGDHKVALFRLPEKEVYANLNTGVFDKSGILVSEWNSGNVSVHDPADGSWKAWKLPGDGPRTYAVYVDELDEAWPTDFGANAIVRFDPVAEKFNAFPSDMAGANVRQLNGRPGETWGGESGTNRLVVVQT